jgi:hypothetical protein
MLPARGLQPLAAVLFSLRYSSFLIPHFAFLTLLHPKQTFKNPALQAITKCSSFQNNPILLISGYQIQSPVSLSIFREFISAFEEKAIHITNTNLIELEQLHEECGSLTLQ